ncbi:hypothetical protein HPB48_010204 [Haemaphysalis longicornis]|uniref:Uncharacterized protein n=1 Tax=Haemaphysalis longicornis TaxID=44386 RepID=A0A9J6G7E3_HAELO|nr:hypothetical protein HPB48_010204 [Haemaphysalis longicornis]
MYTDKDIEKMFVNEKNATILDAKRIKNSKTVALVINGMKVPRYVLMGNCLGSARYSEDNTTYATRGEKRDSGPMCVSTP